MPHDDEIRSRVERTCVENERDLRAFLLGVLQDVHAVDDVFQKTVVKAIEAADQANPTTVRGGCFRSR